MKPKSERTRVVSARDIKTALGEAYAAGFKEARAAIVPIRDEDAPDHCVLAFEAWLSEVPTS